MVAKVQRVFLEDLVRDKLARQLLRDIEHVDIEVWEKAESGLTLKVSKRAFEFRLVIRTSTRRFLACVGGAVAAVTGVLSVLKWSVPILVAYFSKPPP